MNIKKKYAKIRSTLFQEVQWKYDIKTLQFKTVTNLETYVNKAKLLEHRVKKVEDNIYLDIINGNCTIISNKEILIPGYGGYNTLFSTVRLKSIDMSNVTVSSIESLFKESYIKHIRLGNMKTLNEVTSIKGLFANSTLLESIDFGELDTSKVTNLSNTFFKCYELKEIDFGDKESAPIKNMECAFGKCLKLKKIVMKNFKFEYNVITNQTFDSNESLEYVEIPDMPDEKLWIIAVNLRINGVCKLIRPDGEIELQLET